LIDDDLCRRGHSRLQRQITIIDADHYIVGHDILNCLRRLTDLGHFAMKDPLGKGVDGKGSLLSFFEPVKPCSR